MRILVTGADGFIGAAVAHALRARGHDVTPVNRALLDLRKPDAVRWRGLLSSSDAVVNCAGLFAGDPDMDAVNARGAAALFQACADSGVRRVIQFSAIGAPEGRSAFARSKRAPEAALTALDLDWVILRPAIVFGADANGGSALLRGLAALPALPLDAEAGDVQIVQLDDVCACVCKLVEPDAPARIALDLVGPERLSFATTVQRIRVWLGWTPAREWRLPGWLMAIGFALGDVAGLLGWRTPIHTDARAELARGAVGDPSAWRSATGQEPAGLSEALAARPATAQDRTYAALYFVTPLVIVVTALLFIGTGVTSLGPGWDIGVALLQRGGMGELSGPCVIAGAVADLVIGLMILWRPTARLGLWLAIAISLVYFFAGWAILPELWRDPIGPMLKMGPLIVLNIVGLALVRDR